MTTEHNPYKSPWFYHLYMECHRKGDFTEVIEQTTGPLSLCEKHEPIPIMQINFGVNKKVPGKGFTHLNDHIIISGDWESDQFHQLIRRKINEKIHKKYEGYSLTGYARKET